MLRGQGPHPCPFARPAAGLVAFLSSRAQQFGSRKLVPSVGAYVRWGSGRRRQARAERRGVASPSHSSLPGQTAGCAGGFQLGSMLCHSANPRPGRIALWQPPFVVVAQQPINGGLPTLPLAMHCTSAREKPSPALTCRSIGLASRSFAIYIIKCLIAGLSFRLSAIGNRNQLRLILRREISNRGGVPRPDDGRGF